jgi:hypothetical protein
LARNSEERLAQEWRKVPKNWYAIYQWKPAARVGYSEPVAEWITSSLDRITLNTKGLREAFRTDDHRGQIKLNTSISQITEKRIVRALFNASVLPSMGTVIDYEIPLKQRRGAPHGDIDLLCTSGAATCCVEAKRPNSSESLLKAVLQAFTYSMLVWSRRETFFKDFDLPKKGVLYPAVLTFPTAASGRQLERLADYPKTRALISALNGCLDENGIGPLRFFVFDLLAGTFENCLDAAKQKNGEIKAVFRKGFRYRIVEKKVS